MAFMNDGPLEHVPKLGRKLVGQTWLHEETGTTLVLGAFSQGWRSMTGEQDDRNVSSSRLALQILNELPSVTATQREVGDDDVRVKIPSPAVGLLGVGRRDCLETESPKALDAQFTRVVVIVDDEHHRP